jgi:hypothetical protein
MWSAGRWSGSRGMPAHCEPGRPDRRVDARVGLDKSSPRRRAGYTTAGYGRVEAAKKLGLSEAPVTVGTGWSEAKKRAYVARGIGAVSGRRRLRRARRLAREHRRLEPDGFRVRHPEPDHLDYERLVLSRGHCHWQHEPCWYAVRSGGSGAWSGDRKQTTV